MAALDGNLVYADTPYKIDPNNPHKTRVTVLTKIEEICHKLNDPRLDTNENRINEAKKIAAAFPFRPDKVYIYSRRVKDVVLEAKIRIPFLYKMEVTDEPFRPGGIGVPIKEKAVYLYTIQVNYEVPPDGNFDCGPGSRNKKMLQEKYPSLGMTIEKAFDTLDEGMPKLVETTPFPGIPRIAVTIQNIPP